MQFLASLPTFHRATDCAIRSDGRVQVWIMAGAILATDVADDLPRDGSCSDAGYYIALRNEIELRLRPCAVSLVAASFHFRARHTRSSRHRFKLGLG
jgi:hypothetical protein